ncbi:hypothetical protein BOX15_Mlig032368g1, partial [Macrostomum lignano]
SRLIFRALFSPLGAFVVPSVGKTWTASAASAPLLLSRRLAGHSRWQNVRGDKEAGMAQKRTLMSLYTRMLRQAVINGNGSTNVQTNVHLKAVFDKAKSDNVPLKTLERMLAAKSVEAAESYAVEVRGRGGICLLVVSNSPHRTKCKHEVASQVKRIGLEVAGIDSSISKNFYEKKGCVEVAHDPERLPNLDRATELALEFDCTDVRFESAGDSVEGGSGAFVFDCAPVAINSVADGLRSAGLSVLDASVRYEPFERVEIDEQTMKLLNELADRLRDSVGGFVELFDNVAPVGAT